MKKYWYLGILFIPLLLFVIGFSTEECQPHQQRVDSVPQVSMPPLPSELFLCGERVPLEYTDVQEALERELLTNTYWHSQTIQILKRSGRYFPLIEQVLKEMNLPDDLKYITLAESALLHVTSPAGASGYWQLLSETARENGLIVNDEVDERYHAEKATRAAGKYMLASHKKFNDWTLAIASYNVGRRGVERQIERQNEKYYYDLLFNDETARYVFRILAFKIIHENPSKYGFNLAAADYYQPYSTHTVTVTESIPNLANFAHEYHASYKVLKILNPWLRDNLLQVRNGTEYQIDLPHKSSGLYRKVNNE